MKKKLMRVVSMLLTVCMLASMVTICASAAETEETQQTPQANVVESESDVAFQSNGNSVSKILAEALEEEQDAEKTEEEDITNKILDVKIENKTAQVQFNNTMPCKIIVSIYDEKGQEMYGSGMAEIEEENAQQMSISIDVMSMPEYFYVKAYLLDTNNKPLSKQYESNYYTKAFQEFLAKDVEDFEGQEIYNFDEDTTNNFAVFSNGTLNIDTTTKNQLQSYNESTDTYVFTNIDSSMSSLSVGDIFYFTQNEEYTIIKVANISISKGTAIIVNDKNIELYELFSYIKIDTTKDENSENAQGLKNLGISDESNDKRTILISSSLSKKLENGATISGSISGSLTVSFKCYYDIEIFQKDDINIQFGLDVKLSINASIATNEKELTAQLPIGKYALPLCTGLYVTIEPSFVVQGKIEGSLSGKLYGKVGKGYSTENGWEDFSTPFSFNPEIQIEVSAFLGLNLNPKIVFISDKALNFELKGKVGVKLSASFKKDINPKYESHDCFLCISGKMSFYSELSAKINLLNDNYTFTLLKLSFEKEIGTFYFSSDCGFDFGSCPNKSYNITITVMDNNNIPIENVKVDDLTTDSQGKVSKFFKSGENTIEISQTGYETKNFTFNVKKSENKVVVLSKLTDNFVGSSGNNSSIVSTNTNYGNVLQTGYCGNNVNFTLYDDGTLVISGTGNMKNYSYSSIPWYSNRKKIKKVIIKNGVTSIGDDAFYGCSSLTKITIPNSVTSIGDDAFYGCSSLTKITIPNSVTSIGNFAFPSCNLLTNIIIPNSVTSIGEFAFGWCTSLTNITIPNSVTSIGDSAFYDCSSLTSIAIPNSVTSIGEDAFGYCKSLTNITIPNSVTSIGNYAFENCTSLTSITIPNSVTSIGDYAFGWCTSLTNITIPNSVTSIGNYAFHYCRSLTSIAIPNSVTSIGDYAFSVCSSLTKITIPNSVTSIGDYAFRDCSSLTKITIPNSVTSIGDFVFNSCSSLTNITIPNSVTSIGDRAFYYCTSLTNITIPNSVTSIGDDAFGWCTSLTNITIPNSVTSIGNYAFCDCNSLTSITMPNSVTSIGYYSFSYCYNLKDVYYTGTEEEWKKINIYSGNNYLTNATIHYNYSTNATTTLKTSKILAGTIVENEVSLQSDDVIINLQTGNVTLNAENQNTENLTETTVVSNTITQNNLVPNAEYVLMIVNGVEEDFEINTETLLYIVQATADENGQAEFTYYGDLSGENWVALMYGECCHSIEEWVVVRESSYTETGLKIQRCDKCGEIVNQESKPMIGDVNADNRVNIMDASLIQFYIEKMVEFDEIQKEIADYNGDGEININDVTALQFALAHIVVN